MADFILDNFTGTGTLGAHTPDTGGPWVDLYGGSAASNISLDGSGNVSQTATGFQQVYCTGTPSGADYFYEIKCTVPAYNGTNPADITPFALDNGSNYYGWELKISNTSGGYTGFGTVQLDCYANPFSSADTSIVLYVADSTEHTYRVEVWNSRGKLALYVDTVLVGYVPMSTALPVAGFFGFTLHCTSLSYKGTVNKLQCGDLVNHQTVEWYDKFTSGAADFSTHSAEVGGTYTLQNGTALTSYSGTGNPGGSTAISYIATGASSTSGEPISYHTQFQTNAGAFEGNYVKFGLTGLDSYAAFNGFDVQLRAVNTSNNWQLYSHFQSGGSQINSLATIDTGVLSSGTQYHSLDVWVSGDRQTIKVWFNQVLKINESLTAALPAVMTYGYYIDGEGNFDPGPVQLLAAEVAAGASTATAVGSAAGVATATGSTSQGVGASSGTSTAAAVPTVVGSASGVATVSAAATLRYLYLYDDYGGLNTDTLATHSAEVGGAYTAEAGISPSTALSHFVLDGAGHVTSAGAANNDTVSLSFTGQSILTLEFKARVDFGTTALTKAEYWIFDTGLNNGFKVGFLPFSALPYATLDVYQGGVLKNHYSNPFGGSIGTDAVFKVQFGHSTSTTVDMFVNGSLLFTDTISPVPTLNKLYLHVEDNSGSGNFYISYVNVYEVAPNVLTAVGNAAGTSGASASNDTRVGDGSSSGTSTASAVGVGYGIGVGSSAGSGAATAAAITRLLGPWDITSGYQITQSWDVEYNIGGRLVNPVSITWQSASTIKAGIDIRWADRIESAQEISYGLVNRVINEGSITYALYTRVVTAQSIAWDINNTSYLIVRFDVTYAQINTSSPLIVNLGAGAAQQVVILI